MILFQKSSLRNSESKIKLVIITIGRETIHVSILDGLLSKGMMSFMQLFHLFSKNAFQRYSIFKEPPRVGQL